MSVSVRLSVCLSVCMQVFLKNRSSELHLLCMAQGPSLAAICTSGFADDNLLRAWTL